MHEELPFLAEVASEAASDRFGSVESDASRQVFADWLEERGEPKSVVFREEHGPATETWRLRQRALEREFEWDLLVPVRRALGAEPDRAVRWFGLDRGVPCSVAMDADQFVEHAQRLFEVWPWLADLELSLADEPFERLWKTGIQSRLRSLSLRNAHPESLAGAPSDWPRFSRLRTLDLSENSLITETVAAFAHSELMGQLESLRLADCELDPQSAEYLSSAAWPRLRRLDLANNYLGREGVRLLLDGIWLESLEELDLSYNEIDPATAYQLQNIPPQSALRSLNLSSNLIGNVGLEEIAQVEGWESLSKLNLNDNGLTPSGINSLMRATWWPQLTSLSLAVNQLGDESIQALCRKSQQSRLQVLNLTGVGLGDDGVALLGRARVFPELVTLKLLDNAFTADGLRALLATRTWPNLASLSLGGVWGYFGPATAQVLTEELPKLRLRRLDLLHFQGGGEVLQILSRGSALATLNDFSIRASEVDDDGAIALAICPATASITALDLSLNRITDKGARALAESPYLSQLRWLNLSANRLGAEGLEALAVGPALQNLTHLWVESNPHPPAAVEVLLDPRRLPKLISVSISTGTTLGPLQRLQTRFGARCSTGLVGPID